MYNILEHNLLNPLNSLCINYYCDDKCSPIYQVILSLFWGLIFAPWTYGLLFMIYFIIYQELLYYLFTRTKSKYYNIFIRTGVIYAYILGFIIGRTLSCDCILYD
jgi:hypothetical protein